MESIRLVRVFTLILLFISLIGRPVLSQDENKKITIKEERPTTGFNSLKVSGLAEVYLNKGSFQPIRVEVSGMPVEDVIVNSENNILHVGTRGDHNGERVKVYVNFKTLTTIEVSGAAKLFSQSTIKTKDLHISVVEHGAATVEVNVEKLSLSLRQSGDLKISGKANVKQVNSRAAQGTLDEHELEIGD